MNGQKAMLSAGLFMFRLAVFLLVIAGVCRIGEFTYNFCYQVVLDTPVDDEPGRDVSVTLSQGMDTGEMARLMERKGLVEDAGIFRIQIILSGYEDKLQEGTYVLNTSMSPRQMLEVMAGEAEDGT